MPDQLHAGNDGGIRHYRARAGVPVAQPVPCRANYCYDLECMLLQLSTLFLPFVCINISILFYNFKIIYVSYNYLIDL